MSAHQSALLDKARPGCSLWGGRGMGAARAGQCLCFGSHRLSISSSAYPSCPCDTHQSLHYTLEAGARGHQRLTGPGFRSALAHGDCPGCHCQLAERSEQKRRQGPGPGLQGKALDTLWTHRDAATAMVLQAALAARHGTRRKGTALLALASRGQMTTSLVQSRQLGCG